jgi:hypothetical protein
MALTIEVDGFECVYDLNRGPDELLPERRSKTVRCVVHPDILSSTPTVRVDTEGCRTYGDVFKRFAEKALHTLPLEYEFKRIRWYSYNDGSGEAEAEMDD